MQVLAISVVALVAGFLVHAVVQVLHDPLWSIRGPFFARWTRLWELIEPGVPVFSWPAINHLHGSIVRIAPCTYSIADPSVIRPVYGAGSSFTKAPFYYAFGNPDPPVSDLLADLDNKRHAIKRRKVASLYSISALVNYETAIDTVTEQLCQRLNQFATSGHAFDFVSWMQFYAFDVIGEITVGETFGFIQAGSDFNGILRAIHDSMVYGSRIGIIPELHPILAKITQELRIPIPFDLVGKYLRKHIDTRKTAGDTSPSPSATDFLSLLLAQQAQGKLNNTDVLNSLGANIAAGSDTTAISLSSFLDYTLRSPETFRRLRDEVDAAMAGKAPGEPISYTEAQEMVFMQACIKEALRLHPVTGYPLLRVVPEGGAVLAGQYFPGGTQVGINPWVLHRNEDIFGSDPASFRPERWLGAKGQVTVMSNHLLTFGSGARTCIGKNISLLEMSKLIPQIIRRFDVQLEHPETEWRTSTSWFVKQEFACSVRQRESLSRDGY
ncbi:pisatin demethylase [Aspergillus steynii IBT 23096]|uniref:Pisatin demethylase n=1 Tax=Aspergillus steynii IBT 23096 TaxID=1392250 RepID=A0A2I2GM99_9EURO|nr:pisatin demethylase [Aspergillus steynii IBT 23096]PLB53995.1 pisatin demethylase [Aspergillus steynii IBT 23096]